MRARKTVNKFTLQVIAYVSGAFAVATWVLISHNVVFTVNFIAMTTALYVAGSLVVGGGLRKLLPISVISFLAVVISDRCFFFLQDQPLIALGISLFVLLAIIKYLLIKDHDSSWFGALCIVLLGSIFLLVIYLFLAMVQILLPVLYDLTGF
jgi:hypothetical protein